VKEGVRNGGRGRKQRKVFSGKWMRDGAVAEVLLRKLPQIRAEEEYS